MTDEEIEEEAIVADEGPVLSYLFKRYLRTYQLRILCDPTRYRAVLKSRQIGISDLIALEMVLTASGLIGAICEVVPNNCVIISKRDTDAKDVISKCKAWVRRLGLDPDLAPLLSCDVWSATQIQFADSGHRIISETQNPDAGRGKTGHIYFDEYDFYRYQREIWTGALPATESNPNLRLTIITTPNGTSRHFYEVWSNTDTYPDSEWGRHEVDIHLAAKQGMPVDPEAMRGKYTPEQFAQEFECQFLGAGKDLFTRDLLLRVRKKRKEAPCEVYMGIDCASVQDTTAVHVLRRDPSARWLCQTYIITGVPYETNEVRGTLGQDRIVDALIRHHRPLRTVVDVTGDEARIARTSISANLMDTLAKLRPAPPTHFVPLQVRREWKEEWVGQMLTGMQGDSIQIDDIVRDHQYAPREAYALLDGGARTDIADHELADFIAAAFPPCPFPVLTSDFQKLYKRWTSANQVTFDVDRDENGHGDAFWAACYALYACEHKVEKRIRRAAVAKVRRSFH